MFLRAEPSLGVDAAHAHVSAASGTVDGALGRRASRAFGWSVGEFPGASDGRVGVRGDSAGSPRGIFVVGYAMYLVPSVYDVLTVPVAGRSEDEVDEHRASVRDRLAPVLPLAFPELRFRAFRLAGSISRVVHLDEDASQLEEWEAMGVLDGPYPGAIPAFGQLLTGCMVSVRGAVDADPSAPPLSLRKCAAVELLRPTVWRAFPRFAIETCAKLVARLAEEAGRVEELKMNDDARLSHGRFMAARGIAPNVRGSTTPKTRPVTKPSG